MENNVIHSTNFLFNVLDLEDSENSEAKRDSMPRKVVSTGLYFYLRPGSDFNVTASSVVSNWTRTPDLSHHGPVVQKIITGEQRGTGGTRASAMVLMEVL
jgi:hypothetical protein